MAEAEEERIEQLLQEGLDRYGAGDVEAALAAWEQVLRLDPDNAQARDYIGSAEPAPAGRAGEGREGADPTLARMRELVGAARLDEAFELAVEVAGERDPGLEVEALLDLVRARLHPRRLERVGGLDAVPRLRADASRLTEYSLPPNAGFLLSLVDGSTSLGDLVSVSGMDAFEAASTVASLVDAGIVAVE